MSKFITIEGIEGVGKSTAVSTIREYLSNQGIDVVVTREPGGTEISEQIRQVLLAHHAEKMSQDTELLLMFASRAQHIAQVIKPALESNQWVLCDRFTDSSYAYQGGGRELGFERIATLESWVQGDLRPDCTILLDAPVDLAMSRAKKRDELDRIELEQHHFFERTRQAFLELAELHPERYHIVDASQALESVQQQIHAVLQKIVS